MKFSVETKGHNDIIDITDRVQEAVSKSGLKDGLCLVFVAHSTCGITTLEYEEGLVEDLKEALEKLVPSDKKYHHNERWQDDNGYAHLRSALVGTSFVAPVEGNTCRSDRQKDCFDFSQKSLLFLLLG